MRRVLLPRVLKRARMAAVVATLCLALTGCDAELNKGLSENDANEVLAVLLANGIQASKEDSGKTGFTVTVPSDDVLRAITLLKQTGLPRESPVTIGKVFEKSGIMSSPFEERVRYIYALGESVANTLDQIDGVVTARVHIVLPEAPQLGQPLRPSSASVFIKHQANVDLDFFVPQIRRLVSSAIEGLNYDAVTVILTPAAPVRAMENNPQPMVEIMPGLSVPEADAAFSRALVWGLAGFSVLMSMAAAVSGFIWWRGRAPRPVPAPAVSLADGVRE